MTIGASAPRERQLDLLEAQLLDQAEAHLKAGDYAESRKFVDQAISCCGNRYPDRALQVLGSLLKAPDGSFGEQSPAIRCVRQLERSNLATSNLPDARCWAISLNELLTTRDQVQALRATNQYQENQIRELQKQIMELKAVDLETQKP